MFHILFSKKYFILCGLQDGPNLWLCGLQSFLDVLRVSTSDKDLLPVGDQLENLMLRDPSH
jgi:hypothetical protein